MTILLYIDNQGKYTLLNALLISSEGKAQYADTKALSQLQAAINNLNSSFGWREGIVEELEDYTLIGPITSSEDISVLYPELLI